MNKDIEKKLNEFKALAAKNTENVFHKHNLGSIESDNLAKVIRSEKDAQTFMNELKTVIANQ